MRYAGQQHRTNSSCLRRSRNHIRRSNNQYPDDLTHVPLIFSYHSGQYWGIFMVRLGFENVLGSSCSAGAAYIESKETQKATLASLTCFKAR